MILFGHVKVSRESNSRLLIFLNFFLFMRYRHLFYGHATSCGSWWFNTWKRNKYVYIFCSNDYHMFAVDIPRHGKSRPWAGCLDHLRLMNILHAAFDQLNLVCFSMVGISMGGASVLSMRRCILKEYAQWYFLSLADSEKKLR